MNHWLQKKKDREIAQCYIDYAKDHWNHIVTTYDGKTYEIYVNGKKSDKTLWDFDFNKVIPEPLMKIVAEGYCPPPKHTNKLNSCFSC